MQKIEVSSQAPLDLRAQGSISQLDPGTKFTTRDVFPDEDRIPTGLTDALNRMKCLVSTEKDIRGRPKGYKKEFDPRKNGALLCSKYECIYVSSCPMIKDALGLSGDDDSGLRIIKIK